MYSNNNNNTNLTTLKNNLNNLFDTEFNNNDSSITKDFFVDLSDLDEINALEDGDLSLLADPNKFRMLTEALHISPDNINLSASEDLLNHTPNKNYNNQSISNNFEDEISMCSPNTEASSTSSEIMQSFDSKNSAFNNDNNNSKQCQNNNLISSEEDKKQNQYDVQQMPPPPFLPPIVISPADIDNISIQLEKNQQCACKDCGKLFNSVWYLKQHAVKHSNDRPFKCKFCLKTYKFRSNLYQHKCPERNRHFGGIGQSFRKRLYTRGSANYKELYNTTIAKSNENFESNFNHQNLSSLPMSSPSSNNSSLKLVNGLSTTLESNNYEQQTIAPNNQSNYNKLQNIDSSINGYVNDESGVAGINNMQLILNNNQNNLMHFYNNSYDLNSSINNPYGQNNLIKKHQSIDLIEYSDNNCNQQQDTLMLEQEQQQQQQQQQRQHSHQQFMTSYSNYLNCSDCYYTDYLISGDSEGSNNNFCIRKQPFNQEYIDSYMQKNKNRVFPCRKCKLSFPSREYLDRHLAHHNTIESEPYVCNQCPQRFITDKLLQSHFLQHADNSPHKCLQCCGVFRSALALRRHRDQCRQCYCPPFGLYPPLMISPSAPLDPYGFIESEDEIDHQKQNQSQGIIDKSIDENSDLSASTSYCSMPIMNCSDSVNENQLFYNNTLKQNSQKQTIDSGIGSDCSTQSYNISPSSVDYEEDLRFNSNRRQKQQLNKFNFYNESALDSNNKEFEEKNLSNKSKGIEEEDEEDEEEEEEEEEDDKNDDDNEDIGSNFKINNNQQQNLHSFHQQQQLFQQNNQHLNYYNSNKMSYTTNDNTDQSPNFDKNVIKSNFNTLNNAQNYSAKTSTFSSSLFLSKLNDATISQNLFDSSTNFQQPEFVNSLLINNNYYCDLSSNSVFIAQTYCHQNLCSIYKPVESQIRKKFIVDEFEESALKIIYIQSIVASAAHTIAKSYVKKCIDLFSSAPALNLNKPTALDLVQSYNNLKFPLFASLLCITQNNYAFLHRLNNTYYSYLLCLAIIVLYLKTTQKQTIKKKH